MSKQVTLESGNVNKLFFKFAIPSIVGMLAVSMQVMIDGIFLGRNVGPNGLAAVNLSLPLINFLMSIGLMICIGGGVVTSIAYGNQNIKKAKEYTTLTFALLLITLVSISLLILLNLNFAMKLLGANKEIVPFVKPYLKIMMIGAFFYSSPIYTETFVRIIGKPNYAFLSGMVGLFTNVVLDYLFIVKMNLGMVGASSATVIACSASFFALLPNLKFGKFNFDFKIIKTIFYNGSSEMLTVVSSAFATYLFNLVIMKRIGILGVSALTIVFYINTIAVIALYGLSQALQPIVSYNVGARRIDKIKTVLKTSYISGGIIGFTAFSMSHLFSSHIISIFSKGNIELINLTTEALFIISFVYLISFFNIVSSSFLTAIEKPLESALVAFGRSIIFVIIPLFILPNLIGNIGIWLSTPIAEFLCLFVSVYLVKKSFISLSKKISK